MAAGEAPSQSLPSLSSLLSPLSFFSFFPPGKEGESTQGNSRSWVSLAHRSLARHGLSELHLPQMSKLLKLQQSQTQMARRARQGKSGLDVHKSGEKGLRTPHKWYSFRLPHHGELQDKCWQTGPFHFFL
jgi:hypothetical protein